jgi:hypothetical protein
LRRAAPRLFALSWSHYVFLLRIMDEIAALDAESSEVLRSIRRLL